MKAPNMTSSKPYLIRGLYEWIIDNGMIPHIVVNANVNNIKIPAQYVQDGKIILNISATAALNLQVDNDYIRFSARFGGTPMQVIVPTYAVLAIYCKETNAGMMFEDEEENITPDKPKPHLKVVK